MNAEGRDELQNWMEKLKLQTDQMHVVLQEAIVFLLFLHTKLLHILYLSLHMISEIIQRRQKDFI
jgi:hypothetical protein